MTGGDDLVTTAPGTTCRSTQSLATSSLLNANFTRTCPYSRQNFSRLENAADLFAIAV